MTQAVVPVAGVVCLVLLSGTPALAQIETRTPTGGANVTTRKCVAGTNAGSLCNADSDCDSAECFDYNVLDLTVNFRTAASGGWTPTPAQMSLIRGYFTTINDTVADVTDGQVALGTVSLIVDNDAPNAAVQVLAGTCNAAGGTCVTNADCGAGDTCNGGGGSANTGGWGANGQMTLGIGCVRNPLCFTHELMHLMANVRDEYEGALDDGVDNDGDGTIDECNENQSGSRCFGGTANGQPCGFCVGGTNEGSGCSADAQCPGSTCQLCPGGGTCRRIVCIDGGPPAPPTSVPGCLMHCCLQNTDSELCWSGNHDPDVDTEQSQCRDNRSCWAQLGLEWPSVIEVPAGAPQPGPATAPAPVGFLTPSALDRFVAVIDRSASMQVETPRRIDAAITATRDFVDLLTDGTQFGLASFASADGGDGGESSKDFPPEAGLRTLTAAADRSDAKAAASALSGRAAGFTRIGAGLRRARDMLLEAGGTVTLNTSLLLLTDGINNRPSPGAAADLDAALQEMADASIPVFVTCIGAARDSAQCSSIADRTAGRYVDSEVTESVYDAFVEFAAQAQGQEIGTAQRKTEISAGQTSLPIYALAEVGTESVRFVLNWTKAGSDLDLLVFDPLGNQLPSAQKRLASQGEFYVVEDPTPGLWLLQVYAASVPAGPERFSVRTLVDNREVNVAAGLARSAVSWPEVFRVTARPSVGLPVTGCLVSATAEKPDGTTETFDLRDDGAGGDTDAEDGLYQADFRNLTAGDGIYTFVVTVQCPEGVARFHQHDDPGIGLFPVLPEIPSFERVIRFSGTATGVPENLPPVADICADMRVECAGATTPVPLDGRCSSDPDDDPIAYAWSSATGSFAEPAAATPTGTFPLGRNAVSLTVSDGAASSAPEAGLVVVADTTPPSIAAVTPGPSTLWPPNHQMTPVAVAVEVADVCDASLDCHLTSVTSNEPLEGTGDGDSAPDWRITGPLALELRAERAGSGRGRVYTLEVTCTDGSGNAAVRTAEVRVPQSRAR
jgi:hypothetical protein